MAQVNLIHEKHITTVARLWLQAGVSLSSRNIISMCVILFATTTLSGLGPITLAAHEILRQVWIFAIQVSCPAFTCVETWLFSSDSAGGVALCLQVS